MNNPLVGRNCHCSKLGLFVDNKLKNVNPRRRQLFSKDKDQLLKACFRVDGPIFGAAPFNQRDIFQLAKKIPWPVQ